MVSISVEPKIAKDLPPIIGHIGLGASIEGEAVSPTTIRSRVEFIIANLDFRGSRSDRGSL